MNRALNAVLFDVDFTLVQPGPALGSEGYVRIGERHGLALDPARFDAARVAAQVALERHPELDHDEEVWVAFTERIVRGMGGTDPAAHACAAEIARGWERHDNFELYEDTLPVLASLREAGLKLGLISNSARDMLAFARYHGIEVDAGLSSFHHGKTKPHASIFRAVLDLLDVEPSAAAMVGDTVEDDMEGALALGMQAVLLDRRRVRADFEPRIESLFDLCAVLGVEIDSRF